MWAALGLAAVMVAAAGWHVSRGEWMIVPGNVATLAVLAFIAYGKSRLVPLPERRF